MSDLNSERAPTPEGAVELPASWYPIALSHEVRRGEVRAVEFFGRDWVLYRGKDRGTVGLIGRHCAHMGTDLRNAKVVGEQLQCPFHLWRYGVEGRCQPRTKEASAELQLRSLVCRESEGIIFAFYGVAPSFAFPPYPRALGKPLAGHVVSRVLDTPYEALIFNGYDTHHLEAIHHRRITEPPKLTERSPVHFHGRFCMQVIRRTLYDRFVYYFGSEVHRLDLDCWGGNHLNITNEKTPDNLVITSVPLSARTSRIFVYAVTEDRGSWLKNWLVRLRLSMTAVLGVAFLEPDIRIVENMRPDFRTPVAETDWPVQAFWRFWEKIPRSRGSLN